MKITLHNWLVLLLALILSFTVGNCYTVANEITLLHEFAGGANDGSGSRGGLIIDSGKLYGMTYTGGNSNAGTIFSMNSNGTGFSLIHEFAGGVNDGSSPQGSVIMNSGTMYGMTYLGGNSNYGTVFSVKTDGSDFTLLHEFAGGGTDGRTPYGDVLLASGKLYGMTYRGGDSNYGTVFSMNLDGSGFTLLHEFATGTTNGIYPYGNLVMDSGVLYGMTNGGTGGGKIFSIDPDGTDFTILHTFTGGADDGTSPYGSLIVDSGTLYGMTRFGGENSSRGTVFAMDTDGTDFTLLHEFAGGVDDGQEPNASLFIDSGTLYGMTYSGGDLNYGTLFSIETDGTDFTLLHEFAGGNDDGSYPTYNTPLISAGTLYGMTTNGGNSNYGTIFSMGLSSGSVPEIPTSGFLLLSLLYGIIIAVLYSKSNR